MQKYDVVIVGGGPGGLTCGLYLARAGLNAILFEKMFTGGQAATTDRIDNYPGLPGVNGADLGMIMATQAQEMGLAISYDEVTKLELSGATKHIFTAGGQVEARFVVLSTGANPAHLGVPGEVEFTGRGVSYCATCDGNFFKNKRVAVIGGGDTAVEDALYLSKLASEVFLIHRRNELRAAKHGQEKLKKCENVTYLLECQVKRIEGEGKVERLMYAKNGQEEELVLPVDGCFVAVGSRPNSELFRDLVACDAAGYVLAGEDCRTSLPGVYVVGDVRQKTLRQIITAAADGANAAYSITEDGE